LRFVRLLLARIISHETTTVGKYTKLQKATDIHYQLSTLNTLPTNQPTNH
jgi:hypothetical protein